MELVAYIRLFRKWFLLIFLGAFIAGSAAFLFRSRQVELYQARVIISVGSSISDPNPNSAEINTGEQLAQTYVVLAKTYRVLEAAVEAGNFPLTPGQLNGALRASVIQDTSLLNLTVSHADPALAIDLGNEVARQLILNSPSNLTPEQQGQIDLANAEITRLRQQLEQARTRLDVIEAELAAASSDGGDPSEIEQLTQQYNTVINQINQASANIADFQVTISTLQQRTNSLDIVEDARLIGKTGSTSPVNTAILGAVVGAALAFGVALLVEYLDTSIKTIDEASELLGLPALAAIPRFGKKREEYQQKLITYREPDSPISEEYRALRTNLLFSANGGSNKRAYIVTSPGPSEGKSITAANLAVAIAMAGWRVLLVDADLRRPKLHDVFGLENNIGLSTLLSANPAEALGDDPNASGTRGIPQNLRECLQETSIPGLRVITSGYIPLNPTEVLGSVTMQRWFQEFRASTNVDIILFDTPPTLVVADSAVLASTLEIPAVLVVEAGHTRPGAALRAREKLVALDIEIKGFVLNALNPKEQGGSYDYGYSYYYYYKDSQMRSKPVRNPSRKE